MKTLGKFLVAFGVLMGSLGFAANAKGPAPAPAPKGGQIHNVNPPVKPAVKPMPQPNRNQHMVMRPPVQQTGRRSHIHKDNMVHSNCRDCYNLYHLILLNFFKLF